jgi:hypothetical protein
MDEELQKRFEHENAFYLTATPARISKFATRLDLYRRSLGLPGEIIELGVFKGVSLSCFIKFRELFEHSYARKIIAFDVFGNFPDAQYVDDAAARDAFIAQAGSQGISLEDLSALLEDLQLAQNVEMVKGDVLDTLPNYVEQNPALKISLLHIDVDLYEPTKAGLEVLFDRVVRGGIVILDDYGAFAGANKAIDDFFSDRIERVQKLDYTSSIAFVEKR